MCNCIITATGTHYHPDTPSALVDALERLILGGGERVRLWYGDRYTGEAWTEENDVTGAIGRSTGSCKAPILLPTKRSMGGGAIMCQAIVAIRSIETHRYLYRHPTFTSGTWSIRGTGGLWETAVKMPSEAAPTVYSRHGTERAAARLVGFMTGQRFAK